MQLIQRVQAATLTEARSHVRVATGALANSIQASTVRVRRSGKRVTAQGFVETPKAYAIVQEEGRTPGEAWPPEDPIRRWVELRIRQGRIVPEGARQSLKSRRVIVPNRKDQVATLTFLIRRKIGEKGIEGTHFMEQGRKLGDRLLTTGAAAVAAKLARGI
jgi:hypothetical protein